MKHTELLSIGNNLITAGRCMNALAEAREMTCVMMDDSRVGDIQDISGDYLHFFHTVPHIEGKEPIHAYAFRTTLGGCAVLTYVILNNDSVSCGVYSPGVNSKEQYRPLNFESTNPNDLGRELHELTYEVLFDRLDLTYIDNTEIW